MGYGGGWIRRGHPVLTGLIIFLSIVEGIISTWLVAKYNEDVSRAPSTAVRDRARFLLFVSWWTVLFFSFLAASFLFAADSILASIASHLILLFLTWIFWTAGAAAITAGLDGGNNCSNIKFLLIYCNQLNALIGFAWAVWLLISIFLIVVIVRAVKSRRTGSGFRGGIV